MSVVYRGRDTALDREVAVKVLHPHLAQKADSRARFSREARAVARLSHPGIVEIYDYSGDDNAESWLVTEFVHGRTLRAFADQGGIPLPEFGALIGLALADALVHAHGAGVIHRDLKPENVMVAEFGDRHSVKLADFGIARILSQDDRMTMTGAMVGSPNHMAPEVVDGREADERSDVFSLGTILYWLCTGRLPFEAPNPSATLHRLVTGDFPDPRSVNPALGEPLARVIVACLALDPAARPDGAAAVRDRLAAILRADGIDRPEETLTAFLTDPRATAEALRPRIVAARLRRGEEHLARGEIAMALGAFDGVLAVEPRHPAVLAHLAAVARSDRRRRLLRRGGAGLGFLLAGILAALAIARLRERSPAPGNVPGDAAPRVVASPEPALVTPPVAGPPGPTAAAPADPPRSRGPAPREQSAPAQPQAARKVPALVPFTVHVRPYAQRALLDGVEVASDEQRVVFGLGPGVHRIRIEHPCCEPFEREVDAASAERIGELKVPLIARPAILRVGGDPATRVFVEGKLLGTVRRLPAGTVPRSRSRRGLEPVRGRGGPPTPGAWRAGRLRDRPRASRPGDHRPRRPDGGTLPMIALLLVLALASPEADVKRARDRYEFGAYADAAGAARELLARTPDLPAPIALEAWRILGLAEYQLGDKAGRPGGLRPPALHRPRPDPRPLPRPAPHRGVLRQGPRRGRAGARAPARAEASRCRSRSGSPRRPGAGCSVEEQVRSGPPSKVVVVEEHIYLLNFLPFGVGQFQNGDTTQGHHHRDLPGGARAPSTSGRSSRTTPSPTTPRGGAR